MSILYQDIPIGPLIEVLKVIQLSLEHVVPQLGSWSNSGGDNYFVLKKNILRESPHFSCFGIEAMDEIHRQNLLHPNFPPLRRLRLSFCENLPSPCQVIASYYSTCLEGPAVSFKAALDPVLFYWRDGSGSFQGLTFDGDASGASKCSFRSLSSTFCMFATVSSNLKLFIFDLSISSL
uniref:Uncharacterized protein n=1 Tax=Cannabis sativa TaxID=3483 RepID=A0A803QDK0_CANSA